LGCGRGQKDRLRRASKRFFFEKKKQKTFANLGHWRFQQHGPKTKSFLLLFFKKEALFFLLQEQKCPPIF
jgi:hypothetical protein